MTTGGMVNVASSFESGFDGWTTGTTGQSFVRSYWSSAAHGSYYVRAESRTGANEVFDISRAFPAGQEVYGVSFQSNLETKGEFHTEKQDLTCHGNVFMEKQADF